MAPAPKCTGEKEETVESETYHLVTSIVEGIQVVIALVFLFLVARPGHVGRVPALAAGVLLLINAVVRLFIHPGSLLTPTGNVLGLANYITLTLAMLCLIWWGVRSRR